jgi:streptogramin lyase
MMNINHFFQHCVTKPWLLGMLLLGAATMTSITKGNAASSTGFEKIGTFNAVGGVKGSAVGPGPTPGSQRLYLDYMYIGDTIEIVAIDPKTGNYKTFPNPVASESGSYGLIQGPDGNMYMGSLPNAHLYKLDTKTEKLEDLGMPCPGESYIWDIAVAPDKKLYGCTYPNCKVFSYDPATGKMQDLGRMDPQEKYARYIAAGDDGFLYISTGTVHSGIVAYNLADKTFRQILPEADRGRVFYMTYRGDDGKVYATEKGNAFLLENGQATKLAEGRKPAPAQSKVLLPDGNFLKLNGNPGQQHIDTVHGGKVIETHPYPYNGRALNIFRFTATPDGIIYGSSVLPLYVFSLNPADGKFETLGRWGGGESYSLLAQRGKVLLASYSANAILMSYDPAQKINPGDKPDSNPRYFSYEGADHAWRPGAMIEGKDGKVYVGATAGYGALGGDLAIWDTSSNTVSAVKNPIPDQSIASLAAADDGSIYGGTSIGGGGGTTPTQKEAVLFHFDTVTQKVLSQMAPVANAGSITDLIMTPEHQLIGFTADTLFVYDPKTQQVIHRQKVDLGNLIYNSVAFGPDHRIYGLCGDGIFVIDPATYGVKLIARSPEKITSGGALMGDQFYFASLGTVYRYQLPH